MQKTFALIVTAGKEPDKIKTILLYEASENTDSKEALINYIPERNEPIIGKQRMAVAFIPGSRAPGELSEIGRPCGARGEIASPFLDDWAGEQSAITWSWGFIQ